MLLYPFRAEYVQQDVLHCIYGNGMPNDGSCCNDGLDFGDFEG
jgi:hypothetical protein